MSTNIEIRDIAREEFVPLGQLLIDVYSSLEGFPTPAEQPQYYEMLARVGHFTEKKDVKVLVAVDGRELAGGVVYFGDMSVYGSGGIATTVRNASGIRLLGISPKYRGLGLGKSLTEACIELAVKRGRSQVVLHTTKAMQVAWQLYEKRGFRRSTDLDFMQGELPVFGFRLHLVDRGFSE